MTTQTLINIIENRRKSCTQNPTEAQFLAEIVKALKRLQEIESEDEDE